MTQRNKEAGLRYWKNRKKGKIIKCKYCKKEFYVSPYYSKKRKYCSNDCKFLDMKGRIMTDTQKKQISETHKRLGIKPKQIPWTDARRKKLSKSLKGRKSWNKGTAVRKGKYKYITRDGIKKPESHWAWFDNFRYFPKRSEIIHHKNFDEGDNRIENLQLMSRGEHCKIHNNLTKSEKRGEIIYKEFK